MAKQFTVKARFTAEDKASPTIRKVENRFSKFAKSATGGLLGIGAATVAVVKGLDAIQEAAEKVGQRRALESTLESQGIALDGFVAKLQEVSDNQIKNADLILASNRAIKLGIQADDLPSLLDTAARASVDLGISVTQAFNDITTGVGRASPLILDNLGIVVDSKRIYDDFAASISKTTEELTKQERTTALTNAVIATGSKETGNFSDNQDKLTKVVNRTSTAVGNLKDRTAELAAELAGVVVGSSDVATEIDNLAQKVDDLSTGIKENQKVFSEFVDDIERMGEGSGVASDLIGGLGEKSSFLIEVLKQNVVPAFLQQLIDLGEKTRLASEEQDGLTSSLLEARDAEAEQEKQLLALLGVTTDFTLETSAAAEAAKRLAAEEEALTKILAGGRTALEELSAALGESTSVKLQAEILKIEANLLAVRDAGILTRGEFERLSDISGSKIDSLRGRIENLRNGLGDLAPVLDIVSSGFTRGALAADTEAAAISRLAAQVIQLAAGTDTLTQAQERRLALSTRQGLLNQPRGISREPGRFTGFDIPGGTFTIERDAEVDQFGNIIG